MKRTYQPSKLVRKRRHGFRARMATAGGRKVFERAPRPRTQEALRLIGRPRRGRRARLSLSSYAEDVAEWSLNSLHEDGRPEPAGEAPGRLTKRAEFQRVSRGSRISVETFTLQSRRREGAERDAASARIGLTVTKTVGGAVERNRIRRRLKEALRAASPLEAESDHDYVLMARREALVRRFAALVNDVRDAFRAARRRETDSRERRSALRAPKGKDRRI